LRKSKRPPKVALNTFPESHHCFTTLGVAVEFYNSKAVIVKGRVVPSHSIFHPDFILSPEDETAETTL